MVSWEAERKTEEKHEKTDLDAGGAAGACARGLCADGAGDDRPMRFFQRGQKDARPHDGRGLSDVLGVVLERLGLCGNRGGGRHWRRVCAVLRRRGGARCADAGCVRRMADRCADGRRVFGGVCGGGCGRKNRADSPEGRKRAAVYRGASRSRRGGRAGLGAAMAGAA